MNWDWECTHGYVKSIAEHFKLKLCWSWRNRGFHGQVMRKNKIPEAICYKFEHNTEIKTLKSARGSRNTRMKFPAKTASLVSRWCSSCLKIDVARSVLSDLFPLKKQNPTKIIYISGERREESTARSKYEEFPPHPCNINPTGRQGGRIVQHWRMIIDWKEEEVWKIIEKHKIRPHPAYQLGFGRVSCAQCIFLNPDGWSSLNKINKKRIDKIIELEKGLISP